MQSQGSHLWNEISRDFPGRRSVPEFFWMQILGILDDSKLILPPVLFRRSRTGNLAAWREAHRVIFVFVGRLFPLWLLWCLALSAWPDWELWKRLLNHTSACVCESGECNWHMGQGTEGKTSKSWRNNWGAQMKQKKSKGGSQAWDSLRYSWVRVHVFFGRRCFPIPSSPRDVRLRIVPSLSVDWNQGISSRLYHSLQVSNFLN